MGILILLLLIFFIARYEIKCFKLEQKIEQELIQAKASYYRTQQQVQQQILEELKRDRN